MKRIKHGIRNLVIAIIILIVISSFFYHSVEAWTWLDSVFFTVLTITTVGHNNIVQLSAISKIYTSILAFVGIAMVLTLFGIVSSQYVRIANDKSIK